MSLGFEQSGFDVVAAVDNDPVHLAVHERNFPLTVPLCRDISNVSSEELLAAATVGLKRLPERQSSIPGIDCIFGGPSCQGFSVIGRRNPLDPRNSLLDHFARVVEDVQPRSFVIENVPGLLSPTYASALDGLLLRLTNAGYNVGTEAQRYLRLDAAAYGVPQRRKRIFLIGVRNTEPLPNVPTPLGGRPTVEDALDDLPDVDIFDELVNRDWVQLDKEDLVAMVDSASPYARSMRMPADGLARPRRWDPAILTSSARTIHSEAVRKRFADTPQGSEEAVSRNPRLKGSGQSGTLRAGTGRDHGSFSAPRPIHHLDDRVVTVREAARLHSFPDWFRFHVTKWHGFRQVGNSVPPFLARAVADTIVEALGFRPTPPTSELTLGEDRLLSMSLHEAADHFQYDRALLPRDSRLRATASEFAQRTLPL
jgi:DNA (cytosine-5)-methyltransferase 1